MITTDELWQELLRVSGRRVIDGVIIEREHVARALRALRQKIEKDGRR